MLMRKHVKLLSEEIRGQCADVPDISAVTCSSLMVPQLIVKATRAAAFIERCVYAQHAINYFVT